MEIIYIFRGQDRCLMTIIVHLCNLLLQETKHLLCHNVFYERTLAEIWIFTDVYIITD
jgi:hypothetical protein